MATALILTDMLALTLENNEIEIYDEASMPAFHANDLVNDCYPRAVKGNK